MKVPDYRRRLRCAVSDGGAADGGCAEWCTHGGDVRVVSAVVAGAAGLEIGLVATAVALGFRHGFDWDHLAALSDIAASQQSRRRSLALATLYAETGLNMDRGRKLVDEQLKTSPDDESLKALKKRLGRDKPKGPGIQIIRKHK